MGVIAVLEIDGRPVRLADPAGGTFNAAGDFDSLIPSAESRFSVLSKVDPYGDLRLLDPIWRRSARSSICSSKRLGAAPSCMGCCGCARLSRLRVTRQQGFCGSPAIDPVETPTAACVLGRHEHAAASARGGPAARCRRISRGASAYHGACERYRYRADMHIHAVRVAVAALIPSG